MVRVRYSVSQLAVRIMRKNSFTSPFSPISTNTYQLTTLRHTHVLDLKKSSHTRDTMTLKCTLRWLLFFSGRGFRHSVSGELGIYTNSQVFESALPSGHFWIRYESGIAWTLNPDIFFLSGDVKRSIPVLYREYCIQEGNLYACSGANILRGVLDTRMNPDTCWIRGYKQIRFE